MSAMTKYASQEINHIHDIEDDLSTQMYSRQNHFIQYKKESRVVQISQIFIILHFLKKKYKMQKQFVTDLLINFFSMIIVSGSIHE